MGSVYECSDVQLVELYNGGNTNAFTVIADRYLKLIRSITSKYNISGLECDDLIQEGLLGLLCAVKSYRADGGASFGTYVGVCVKRRILTLLERSGSSKSKALNNYLSLDDDEAVLSLSDGMADPEELFIFEEQLNHLREKISERLSEKERRVFDLYLAGESYEKIASELRISTKSVDNALQRIRRKIRKNVSEIPM